MSLYDLTSTMLDSPDDVVGNQDRPLPRSMALHTAEIVQAADIGRYSTELTESGIYFLNTAGKRLRPTIVLRCAEMGPRPDDSRVRIGAAAVELFQLATLAHDDVVDDGRVRRGVDSVAAAYGNYTAGFLGGALFARAGELVATCGEEPIQRFAQTASEVCAGQMAEFEDIFDTSRSTQRYRESIAGKTASLFSLAAWLGARLAGSSPAVVESASQFGCQFGMAFQIADDVLDLVAPESVTGKRQFKDLREGIYSLPVLYALERDRGLRHLLERDLCHGDLLDITNLIHRSGGIGRAIDDCMSYLENARHCLEAIISTTGINADDLTELLDRTLASVSGGDHPYQTELTNGR